MPGPFHARVTAFLRWITATYVGIVICLAGSSARAGENPCAPSDEQVLYRAKEACQAGDLVRGIAILEDLFSDTLDRNYIFYQGRCYQMSSQWRRALGRFEEILRTDTSKVDHDLLRDTEQRAAECRRTIRQDNLGLAAIGASAVLMLAGAAFHLEANTMAPVAISTKLGTVLGLRCESDRPIADTHAQHENKPHPAHPDLHQPGCH